jgi:hypothetical protein
MEREGTFRYVAYRRAAASADTKEKEYAAAALLIVPLLAAPGRVPEGKGSKVGI